MHISRLGSRPMLALALATLAGCAEAAGEGEIDAAVADAPPGGDADPGPPDADPGLADAELDAAVDATPGSPDALPADAAVADARPPDASIPDAAPPVLHWEFQDGVAPTAAYAGTTDTYLFQNEPTTNFGALDTINVDGSEPLLGGKDVRGLLRWGLAAIPRSARVDSARIVITATNGGGATFTVRAMSTPWNEREATWNERVAGTAWQTAGGSGSADRAGATLASFAVPGDGGVVAVELNAAGVAAVQGWVTNPDTNHGVMFDGDAFIDGIDFHAREAVALTGRPRLVVDLE